MNQESNQYFSIRKFSDFINCLFVGVTLVLLRVSSISFFTNRISFTHVYSVIFVILAVGIAFNLLTTIKYDIFDSFFIFMGLLTVLVKNSSGSILPLVVVMTMFLLRNVNYKTILITYLLSTGIVWAVTVCLSLVGVFPQTNLPRYNGGYKDRFTLGFTWVSFAGQQLFFITSALIVLIRNKIKYVVIFILFLLNVYVYLKTNTKNPFVLASIFLIIIFLSKILKNDKLFLGWINSKLLLLFYPIIFIVTIITAYTYNPANKIEALINSVTSGRLQLANLGVIRYGISLLGNKISFNTTDGISFMFGNYFYVDSSYVQYAMVYGAVFTIILIVLLSIVIWVAKKVKDYYLLLFLILAGVHAMFDPQLMFIEYTPLVLIIPNVIKTYFLNIKSGETNGY